MSTKTSVSQIGGRGISGNRFFPSFHKPGPSTGKNPGLTSLVLYCICHSFVNHRTHVWKRINIALKGWWICLNIYSPKTTDNNPNLLLLSSFLNILQQNFHTKLFAYIRLLTYGVWLPWQILHKATCIPDLQLYVAQTSQHFKNSLKWVAIPVKSRNIMPIRQVISSYRCYRSISVFGSNAQLILITRNFRFFQIQGFLVCCSTSWCPPTARFEALYQWKQS